MLDHIAIGALAASTLSLAAETAGKTLVGEAVKDAYKALKTYLSDEFGPQALEAATSEVVLAQAIDAQPDDVRERIEALTRQLLDALEETRPVGVDIDELKALSVSLDSISVADGTGVRIRKVETPGGFRLSGLSVGDTQKKT